MILHIIVVHDPGVVVAGGIYPVRTCLVSIKGRENPSLPSSNNMITSTFYAGNFMKLQP